MDSEGRTTASAKEASAAPRRPGVRRDSPRPKPPAKEVGKVARKRRISDVEGAQSGPTARNRDRKLTAVRRRGIHTDPRFAVKNESP